MEPNQVLRKDTDGRFNTKGAAGYPTALSTHSEGDPWAHFRATPLLLSSLVRANPEGAQAPAWHLWERPTGLCGISFGVKLGDGGPRGRCLPTPDSSGLGAEDVEQRLRSKPSKRPPSPQEFRLCARRRAPNPQALLGTDPCHTLSHRASHQFCSEKSLRHQPMRAMGAAWRPRPHETIWTPNGKADEAGHRGRDGGTRLFLPRPAGANPAAYRRPGTCLPVLIQELSRSKLPGNCNARTHQARSQLPHQRMPHKRGCL